MPEHRFRENELISLPAPLRADKLYDFLRNQFGERGRWWEEENEPAESRSQPLLRLESDNRMRVGNYVGWLHYEGADFRLYPKCWPSDSPPSEQEMIAHLLHWLQQGKSMRFPMMQQRSGTDNTCQWLPDVLILHFCRFAERLLRHKPLQRISSRHQPVSQGAGRLNNRQYQRNVAQGNLSAIALERRVPLRDIPLHRILKHVCERLSKQTKDPQCVGLLSSILQHLQGVGNLKNADPCLCDKVKLSIQEKTDGYEDLLDMCRFFLHQAPAGSIGARIRHWNLLLPMETLFEDYVARLMESRFSRQYKVIAQGKNLPDPFLTHQKAFRLKPDLFLKNRNPEGDNILIDLKYKIREDKKVAERGVKREDMHQMLSYASALGVSKILLLYPNQPGRQMQNVSFSHGGEANEPRVTITAAEIPFVQEGKPSVQKVVDAINALL